MDKAKELKTTTDLVRHILQQNPQARSSDNCLYYMVLSAIGKKNGVDIERMSIPHFLFHLKDYGFPGFETVRRSRQKLQAEHPELAACDAVEGQRILNEQTFRDYARGHV